MSSKTRGRRPLGPPMLCKTIDVVPDDPQYLVSRKVDGWRARATSADGAVRLSTREGHAIDNVPYIEAAVLGLVPPGTVLDGELVDLAGPRQLKRTGSILPFRGAHKPTLDNPPITLAVFDILFDGDTDLRDTPLHERLAVLERLFGSDAGRELAGPLIAGRPEPALMLLEHRPSTPAYAQQLIDAGEEGVVVKHRDSLYRHGPRTAGWWKFKPQETVDAECTGFEPGKSGSAGSITFRLESGVQGSAGSGISDREWLDMTEHPERYVGRLIELAHHGEEKSGALRHPVYRGVRDPRDKAAPRARAKAPRKVPGSTALATAVAGGSRRRRSYEEMGDPKLATCVRQLRARQGDAYDRCVERGSGDPAGDLAYAEELARARRLDV
jgi:ATP-dependent DNA ligase